MAKASINFKPVKALSEAHNERLQKLDYIEPEFSDMNETSKSHSIAEMEKEIKRYCKATSGRKLQKNAEPIREAVVNLNHYHSADDLHKLNKKLEEKFGMKAFQTHIHRDEGIWEGQEFKHNYHAHILFRWQDMATGKTLRLNKKDLSQIQTLVANELGMERGEFKENSNRERLEAVEYKVQQESFKANILEEKNQILEQKKNKIRGRIAQLEGERGEASPGEDQGSAESALKRIIFLSAEDFGKEEQTLLKYDENSLNKAVKELEHEIKRLEANV